MPSNSRRYRLRSIRLSKFDYTQMGAYFVTICVQNREWLFGKIVDDAVQLNDFGQLVVHELNETARLRSNVELDEFVVMPDHVHVIFVITESHRSRITARRDSTETNARRDSTIERFGKPVPGSIPTIVRSFKSAVTKRINIMRQTRGAKIWQRNYYEHVIRNEFALQRIKRYIINNPAKWQSGE